MFFDGSCRHPKIFGSENLSHTSHPSYLVTEHHITELAFVRLNSQVNSQMPFQIALLHKLLGAMGALVSGTNMDEKMFIEAVSSVELLVTVGANMHLRKSENLKLQ